MQVRFLPGAPDKTGGLDGRRGLQSFRKKDVCHFLFAAGGYGDFKSPEKNTRLAEAPAKRVGANHSHSVRAQPALNLFRPALSWSKWKKKTFCHTEFNNFFICNFCRADGRPRLPSSTSFVKAIFC